MFNFSSFRREPGAPSPSTPDSTIETYDEVEAERKQEYKASRKEYDGMSLDELRQEYREEDERLSHEDTDLLAEEDQDRKDQRVESADFDALKHAYAEKIAHALQRGELVTPEEKRFLLEDMIDRKPESALGNVVFKSHGYKTAQEAMSRLGVKRVVSKDGSMKLDKDQENWFRQQSPYIQETIKDIAKGGAATAAACGIITLLGGPIAWGVVGASYLGGVAGKAIARGISRKGMYTGLNEDAMREMLTEVSDVHALADKYLIEHERGADNEESLNGILNGIVDLTHSRTGDKINGQPGAREGFARLREFQNRERSAKKWEVLGGVLGSVAGGGAAALYESIVANKSAEFAQAVAEAKVNGIRIANNHVVTDGSSAGHIVKYVDNAWRFVTTQGDINHAQALLHNQYSHYFHVMGQGGGPHLEMTQNLFNDFASSHLDLLHVSELSGVPEAILAQMKQDIILNGLKQAGIVAGMFTVGDLLENSVYNRTREHVLRDSADKAMHNLYTPGVAPVVLEGTRTETTPAVTATTETTVPGGETVVTTAEEDKTKKENDLKDNLYNVIGLKKHRIDELSQSIINNDTLEKIGTSGETKQMLANLLLMDDEQINDKDKWPENVAMSIEIALSKLTKLKGKTEEEVAAAIYGDNEHFSSLAPDKKAELSARVAARYVKLVALLESIQELLAKKEPVVTAKPEDAAKAELDTAKSGMSKFITDLRVKDDESLRDARAKGKEGTWRSIADYAGSISDGVMQWFELEDNDAVILYVEDPKSVDVAEKVKQIRDSGKIVKVFLKSGKEKGEKQRDALVRFAAAYGIPSEDVYLAMGRRDTDWKGFVKNLAFVATNDKDGGSVAANNSHTVEYMEI